MGTPAQPAQLPVPLAITRFTYGGDDLVRGLFVLFMPAGASEQTPANPALFQLGFTDKQGVLRHIGTMKNPWRLALVSGADAVATSAGVHALTLGPTPHFFAFVTHPSAKAVADMLANLKASKGPSGQGDLSAWKIHRLTPKASPQAVTFELPKTAADFNPGGHSEYGGWCLYKDMPHEKLGDVPAQTKKLAFHLSRLRYPAALQHSDAPYEPSEGSHDGDFDLALQAALHLFQKHAADGKAFKVSDAGKAKINEGATDVRSWGYLLGADTTTAASVIPTRGIVDIETADALLRWHAEGLRKPGKIYVQDGNLWMEQTLSFGLTGLAAMLSELKALQKPSLGNTSRRFPSKGKGQVSDSQHKLGRAVDFGMSSYGEPAVNMMVAVEANWVLNDKQQGIEKKRKTLELKQKLLDDAVAANKPQKKLDQLRGQRDTAQAELDNAVAAAPPRDFGNKEGYELDWLLYMHSALDPIHDTTDEVRGPVATGMINARRILTERFNVLMGQDGYTPEANAFVTRFEQVGDKLVDLAGQPGGPDSTTALGRDYFRAVLQRFQWQSDQTDAGDNSAPRTAAEDAKITGVTGNARSFVNLTRIASDLGIQRIKAQRDYRVKPGFTPQGVETIPLFQGDGIKMRISKAVELDRVAAGIRFALSTGQQIVVGGAASATLPPTAFKLVAISDWMGRPSDDSLPRAEPEMSYPDIGLDLTIKVLVDDQLGRDTQIAFLNSRASIEVQVLKVGAGLQLNQTLASPALCSQVADALRSVTKVVGQADHTITLRPIFMDPPLAVDPGKLSFTVPKLATKQDLEWWHLELPPDPDKVEWTVQVEQVGSAAEVFDAPVVPDHTAEGPVWQSGAGLKRRAVNTTPLPGNNASVSQDFEHTPAVPSAPAVPSVPSVPSLP